jgi:hypothetical protein
MFREPVLAAGAGAVNDTTGANSENESKIEIDNDLNPTLNNDQSVTNEGYVSARTGTTKSS